MTRINKIICRIVITYLDYNKNHNKVTKFEKKPSMNRND